MPALVWRDTSAFVWRDTTFFFWHDGATALFKLMFVAFAMSNPEVNFEVSDGVCNA
jgi:hypothetical protein